MKLLVLILTAILSSKSAFASSHFCADQVKAPAAKLLALQNEFVDPLTEGLISDTVIELPSIKSPDGKRKYAVLETSGETGKMGGYRIRMIYSVLGHTDPKKDCFLVGQEILDMGPF